MTTPFDGEQLLNEAGKWHNAMHSQGVPESITSGGYAIVKALAQITLGWDEEPLGVLRRLREVASELAHATNDVLIHYDDATT